MNSLAYGTRKQRPVLIGTLVAFCLSCFLILCGCGGVEDGGDLSVGATASDEGVANVTYLGAVIEDTVAFGSAGVATEYQSKDSTEYLRYVFDVTNESGGERQISDLLPLKAAIIDQTASEEEGEGSTDETSSTQLSNPSYIAQDNEVYDDQTIASRATDTISIIFEITPEEAKAPENIEASVLMGNTEYTIPGSTILDATPYQQQTADIADSYSTLLMTTYQNASLNASMNMYPNPTSAFQGVQNAASQAAAEIKTDLEQLSSAEVPDSYEEGKSAFEASLKVFEDYFSQVAAIDPSNPSACSSTISQLNTSMESQLPQFKTDVETACEAMPYLQLMDYSSLPYYFSSMNSYAVTYYEF